MSVSLREENKMAVRPVFPLLMSMAIPPMISMPVSYTHLEGVTEILGVPVEVNYLRIALLSPVLTASSILGDLSASVLKRQYGVKDYGSIMPGHGGIMDRFDSVLFVLPAVFLLSVYLPLIQL